MTHSTVLPRKTMLLIALAQGVALLFLYRSLENGGWPSESPLWAFPLWTLSIALPALLLLSLESAFLWRGLVLVGGFAVVLALLAFYTGWQTQPFGKFPIGNLVFVFVCSMGLACFKGLMYLQQRAASIQLSYNVLFSYSWRNSLTLALSLLFVFIFWLVLTLWGELFRAINVEFFFNLFRKDWFLFPVLGLSLGLAIIIFRDLTRVIDSITRLLQGLIKLLLPLIITIAVLFLLAIPFVGLDALWETGRGAALLLWLLALVLFFTNAVYQDGRGDTPYPPLIHRLIYAGLLVLPAISVISFYGLYLRLEEYGWTIARCWAFVAWLVLSLFALGYGIGIVRRKDAWTQELARVNTAMGLIVLALMLGSNSPLLDFRKIAVSSQLQRVDSGEIELAEFDFWYASDWLARPGYLALEEMKQRVGDSNPDLLERISNRRPAGEWISSQGFWSRMTYRPEPLDVPAALRTKIGSERFVVNDRTGVVLIRADLDADGDPEYVLVSARDNYIVRAELFFLDSGPWVSVHLIHDQNRSGDQAPIDSIKQGDIGVRQPRFALLQIGDLLFQVPETNAPSASREVPGVLAPDIGD